MQLDDAFDDVAAAYKEVASKPETTPNIPAPTEVRSEPTPAPETPAAKSEERPANARGVVKDERGRFTSKKVDSPQATQKAQERPNVETVQEEDEEDKPASEAQNANPEAKSGNPPPSWSVKAKSSWDQLPDHVKSEIAKRETEVAQGLAVLKDYKDLKPYADMARKSNTTIAAALQRFTGIEQMLRKDIAGGLAHIAQNYGLNQAQAAQVFAGLAKQYGAMPQGNAQPQQNGAQPKPGDPLYDILRPFIDPLNDQVNQLRDKLSSREAADRNVAGQSLAKAIEVFSADPSNPYFPDLEEHMSRLFETGMVPLTGNHESDLRTAYDTAAQMVPEVREALIEQRLRQQTESQRRKEQEAADRAKKASRSLTGSRVPGTVVQTKQQTGFANGLNDIEADVRAAYNLHAQH